MMNKHGYPGIQRHAYPSKIPFYCELHIRLGRNEWIRCRTRGFATAKEAYRAGILLRRRLQKRTTSMECAA